MFLCGQLYTRNNKTVNNLGLKAVDTIGNYSKIIISIEPFSVTSNGEEVDGLKHYEKRLPLKCHSFRERSNFPRIWFQDLRFRTWGLKINHLNAHNFVWQGCFFLSLLSRKFNDRLSSNFHRFIILCIMLRYTNCEG